MIRTTLKAAGMAAAASLALSAPALAAPGAGNASAACTASGDVVMDFPVTHGACVSYLTTGAAKGGAYAAQCRNITGGKYPFTFYGVVTVKNPGECLNALRGFHTDHPPMPPA